MGNVDHPSLSEGAEAALISVMDQVLATIKEIDLAVVVETFFGAISDGQFIMELITDMIVHGCDIAEATGTNATLGCWIGRAWLQRRS